MKLLRRLAVWDYIITDYYQCLALWAISLLYSILCN
nr:MAG TPA: hypothetical protein [Bacteriophage sp.]